MPTNIHGGISENCFSKFLSAMYLDKTELNADENRSEKINIYKTVQENSSLS